MIKKKSGAQLIAEERKEQIKKHGFDVTNDEDYSNMELIQAALFCIDAGTPVGHGLKTYKEWPQYWGTRFENKILNKDRVNQLRVAGAFIAAEIDRIQNS